MLPMPRSRCCRTTCIATIYSNDCRMHFPHLAIPRLLELGWRRFEGRYLSLPAPTAALSNISGVPMPAILAFPHVRPGRHGARPDWNAEVNDAGNIRVPPPTIVFSSRRNQLCSFLYCGVVSFAKRALDGTSFMLMKYTPGWVRQVSRAPRMATVLL